MGRQMGEKQSNQEDKELVLVAFEGEIASLATLVRLARECGFRKVLSALVKDLQKAQAETIEIIAMAADDELRERLQVD
jgi:ferritin-like metal-binding protein YciE